MRFLATAIGSTLFASSTAWAGGVGIVGTGGMHTETVHFYSSVDAIGDPYANFRDYDQYQLSQTLGNGGFGIELMLGDRDDKITGVFRGFYNIDQPQQDPATVTSLVAAEAVVWPRPSGWI